MHQYLDLLKQCRDEGVRQKNRTGIDTFMIPGDKMQFDLSLTFPILTTKKVNFDAIKAELCGFLRGYSSAAQFRRLGTKIWDANANDPKGNGGKWYKSPYRKGEDDLGRIYGVQWRDWYTCEHEGKECHLDQIKRLLETIHGDPTSRRMIVSAWRPDELEMMALPPCHLLFQVLIEQETKKMHMTMYQRSCDMFLGVPFNISSYALLLSMLARVTGYKPGKLTMFLADVHIYENHLTQVDEQLGRNCGRRPTLKIDTGSPPTTPDLQLLWLSNIEPYQITLEGYEPQPAIKADMAA